MEADISASTLSVTSKTAAYTVTTSDDLVLSDSSGGAFTLDLYTATTSAGKVVRITKTDSSTNAVTIDAFSTQTINGNLTTTLNTQYESIDIVSDGINWFILTRNGINTAPVSFPPTGGWTSNVTYTGSWERQGKFAVIRMKAAATGAPSSGSLSMSFSATGFVIDTADPSILSTAASQTIMGTGVAVNFGLQQYPISVMYNTTNSIVARERRASGTYVDSNGAITPSVPFTFGSTDFVEVTIRVPITGWKGDDE